MFSTHKTLPLLRVDDDPHLSLAITLSLAPYYALRHRHTLCLSRHLTGGMELNLRPALHDHLQIHP